MKLRRPYPTKAFDFALIIALAGTAITVTDHIMREHRAEPLGSLRVPSGMILATRQRSLS